MTDAAQAALALLRDTSNVSWSVVAFLGLVIYVYAVEVERRRWDVVAAGLAFILFDVFNELVNSAVLHVSNTAPLWAVTGETSYLILVGWCIEIVFLFLISGIVFVKMLPADRKLRILGIPNRWLLTLMWSCICVGVELLLEAAGIFHWHYAWWGSGWGLIPVVLFGYATFFATAAAVFDMRSDRRRFTVIGAMAAVDAVLALTFGLAGWL